MKCVGVYKELYHQEPFDVAFCPYRISPLGAHIDHQYGKINGLAIDKGIHMAYHPKQNGVVELQSLNFPKRAQFFVSAVPEEKQGDWADPHFAEPAGCRWCTHPVRLVYYLKKKEDTMEIVVLDGYTENPGDLSWDAVKSFGTLTVYDRTPADDAIICKRIGNADIVITNKTPISAYVIASCPSIKFISVLATGYNVVDTHAAAKAGIPVSNIPTYGTMAVGQFAIAMLLEICHHIGAHNDAVHQGRWETNPDWCFWDSPLIELAQKTIGIIGFGRVGQTTGRIAKALGMNVLAYDSHPNDVGREIADYVELDELLRRSDVISLHCPLFPETKEIICAENIAKMKDGVIVLNNARGGLIVEADLASALHSGKIYAAGLDVVSTEPIQSDSPLLAAPNCIITPHISWAPKECRQRIMDMTADNIQHFISSAPIHVVNR